MGREPWALTGRDAELGFALDALDRNDRAGLVVTGPAGVGKSRLVEAVVGSLGESWAVARATATHGSASIPFGALAPLLDHLAVAPDDHRLEPPDLLSVLRQLRAVLADRRADRRLLLVVDDAHLLDAASAALVHQLARTGEATIVAAVRSGAPYPAEVGDLWKEQLCDVLDLQPLARDEVGVLVAEAVGAWPEQESLDRLHEACAGNPLLLRELLADAQASDRLERHRGLVRWAGVAGTPRLTSLVTADLDRLADDDRAFLDLLCVGEPMPMDVAHCLADDSTLVRLERAGLIVADGPEHTVVRLGHPIFGEVRRAGLGRLQRRDACRRLADAFDAAGHHHPDDRMRIACWRLEADDDLDADLLADAAHRARALGDASLAERLARAARRRYDDPDLDLLLAEVAEVDGRPDEAAALLDGLAGRLRGDDQRARALSAQIRVLAHALGRPDDAAAVAAESTELVTDEVWSGFVNAQWATTVAMLGHMTEAATLGEGLFSHPDPRVQLRALPAVNLVAYDAGRLDEALAASQAMVGPALALRDEVPAGIGIVFSALALDLLALGRLDELDDLIALAVDPTVSLPSNRAYLLAVQGTAALRRGAVATANRLLRESLERFGDADPQGFRAVAAALLAQSCGLLGDRAGAAAADAEAGAAMTSRPPRLLDLDVDRARAWAALPDGGPGEVRRRLRAAASTARRGDHVLFEAAALHDLVLLGAGREEQRRLRSLARSIDGTRAAAMAAHAGALLDRDPDQLVAVADRFVALGEHLVAATALQRAATELNGGGRAQAGRRAAARSRSLLARCEGATVTTHTDLAVGPALTPRETQVARLAAAGRSSRDIADDLGVSVRTVDNQLSRVYTKLGIGGRADLAQALAELDRPDDETGP